MLDRTALTGRYLDEVIKGGLRAGELLGGLPDTELLNAFQPPGRKYLSRPLFLGQAEREQLYQDVEILRAAVVSLPQRWFGGDFAAFARAAGAGETYIAAVLREQGAPTTRLCRADLYADQSGFRLLELNLGSALGGMENADMCRELLKHPLLAQFAAAHGLSYVDTMREQLDTMLLECGLAPGSGPMVAVTDWPTSYERKLGPYFGLLAARWRELGLDAHACQLGQLQVRGGRVWLDGRPVDIIARMFMIEYLMEAPQSHDLLDPVLDAVARGEVKMFAPLDADLFSSKAALAMLSDDAFRHLFSPAEQASIDRIVPWTRILRPGPVTLPDGRRGELMDFAAAHQAELALKPAIGHGGAGMVLGWGDDISPARWRTELARAAADNYIVQERISPVPELIPGDDGELVPWVTVWGPFTTARGYGGTYIRAARADSELSVVNRGRGAYAGCCLSG